MNNRNLVIIVVLLAVGFAVLWLVPQKETPAPNAAITGFKGDLKKDASEGDLTVNAEFTEENSALIFQIGFDTTNMSADIESFDPKQQIYLERNDGTKIYPASIEKLEEGHMGHHPRFQVVFPKINGTIKLVIADLAGIPRREIVWSR